MVKRPYGDQDARWGNPTDPDARDGKGMFYGYKLHLICDSNYGVPLAHEVLPTNRNDPPTLPCLMDQVEAKHPCLKMRYPTADKGYDALSNYRHLDRRGIVPVIPLRNTDKEGLYDQKGRPLCFGNKPMEYVGTDPDKGHLFRCRQQGCHLKNRVGMTRYCDIECYETLKGDALLKVGQLPRTTRRWKRLYKRRTSVERAFRSLIAQPAPVSGSEQGTASRLAVPVDLLRHDAGAGSGRADGPDADDAGSATCVRAS